MTEPTTNSCGAAGRDVQCRTRPLAGVIVLLVCLTILITFSVAGDWLENGMTLPQEDIVTLAQEDISPFCPMPAELGFSLAGLSREARQHPARPKAHFIRTRDE
jgi:hypothetical protein